MRNVIQKVGILLWAANLVYQKVITYGDFHDQYDDNDNSDNYNDNDDDQYEGFDN